MNRIAAVALLLLAALGAEAQFVSPVENAYGSTAADYALAASRNGALLAWTQTDPTTGLTRIELARTDAAGRVIGRDSIADPRGDLAHPSLAGDGDGFLLAFNLDNELFSVTLDPNGRRSASPLPIGNSITVPAALVWRKDHYLLWSADERLQLGRDGRVIARSAEKMYQRAAATDDALLFYSSWGFPGGYHCGFVRCYNNLPAWFDVSWRTEGTDPGKGNERRDWYTAGSAAAAGSGREFALAWIGPQGTEGVFVRDGNVASAFFLPALGDLGTTPAVATDGVQYMLAFEAMGDIYGAFLTAGGTAKTFPISTAIEPELRVRVEALGSGRFLVTYVRQGMIRGRVVVSEEAPGRRRTVR